MKRFYYHNLSDYDILNGNNTGDYWYIFISFVA